MPGDPSLGRAGITSPDKWTEMTGKVTELSPPPRVEASANDAPTFPPIKAEAFDEEGRIKPEFMSRFMRAALQIFICQRRIQCWASVRLGS